MRMFMAGLFMLVSVLGAGVGMQTAAVAEPAAAAVNVGNKVCPFMNNPVTEATAVKVEYKGKVYNVCCNNCKAAFLKDPEAAIKKFVEVASPAKM